MRYRRSLRSGVDIWPAWVDALSSLLMVVMFVLLVFIVSQFYLSNLLSGRNQEVITLKGEISALTQMLSLEKSSASALKLNVETLQNDLRQARGVEETLRASLTTTESERDRLVSELASLSLRLDEVSAQRGGIGNRLANANAALDEGEKRLRDARGKIIQLQTSLVSQREARARLEEELTRLALTVKQGEDRLKIELAEKQQLAFTVNQESLQKKTLEDALNSANARESDHRLQIAALSNKVATVQNSLSEQLRVEEAAKAQLDLLNDQMTSLREQLGALNTALDVARREADAKNVQIADLGRRLNVALAGKVGELAQYRSEFFGKLRELLGQRQDVRIVGDRFVFQAEVLFKTGEAILGAEGQAQLQSFAQSLLSIAQNIPQDIDWILRIDGHTDNRPIATPQFPSNWELSSGRAIAVLKYLIAQGVPPHRLVAAGFGEFRPLENSDTPEALQRNRRIEMKLDQR
jgi:chemotaxis protein MotB